MKRIYHQPLTVAVRTEMSMMICGSQDITSDKGISYGGVDENGELDPESRKTDYRYRAWEDEEEEEEYETW